MFMLVSNEFSSLDFLWSAIPAAAVAVNAMIPKITAKTSVTIWRGFSNIFSASFCTTIITEILALASTTSLVLVALL